MVPKEVKNVSVNEMSGWTSLISQSMTLHFLMGTTNYMFFLTTFQLCTMMRVNPYYFLSYRVNFCEILLVKCRQHFFVLVITLNFIQRWFLMIIGILILGLLVRVS